MPGSAPIVVARFTRILAGGTTSDGPGEHLDRAVSIETPIAIEFNGIGYAVLMATPSDLDDLAVGFAFAERLVSSVEEIVAIERYAVPVGHVLRVTLVEERVQAVFERVRHRVSESSCGLCGIENLEQALRPLPRIRSVSMASDAAIFAAAAALSALQPMNAATGAMHAAAFCGGDGAIRLVREDVGRHNAFDKLIGAMARDHLAWQGGFALLSSRCSYELVEKAALADCPLLVTVSAPTSLALERARDAGLPLVALARQDSFLRA